MRAVFLDRDDTINRDVPYCGRPEDFELLPGAAEGVRRLNEAGFLVVVLTNQSGVGRGYFDEETLATIHARMREELAREGARVDAIYHCPHHPDAGCACRKPRPELGLRAARDLEIELGASFVVGDRALDVELARRLGCRAVMVPSEKGRSELEEGRIWPDHVAADLREAAAWIVAQG